MPRNLRSILRNVLLYVAFSALWILFSDQAANELQARFGFPEIIETYKQYLRQKWLKQIGLL